VGDGVEGAPLTEIPNQPVKVALGVIGAGMVLSHVIPIPCSDELDYRTGINAIGLCQLFLDLGYDDCFGFAGFSF
jgi:hypothetical protein